MTPRLEWTWDNFFASGSIRLWCYLHCKCSLNQADPDPNYIRGVWAFIKGHELALRPNGAIIAMSQGSQQSTQQLLPPQPPAGSVGGTSRSGTCGDDRMQFCPTPWPAAWGPKPQEPADSGDDLSVCGNLCKSPQDCSPSNSGTDCSCVEPSPNDAKKYGLDPIFPPSICLALVHTVIKTVPGGINGRDVDVIKQYPYTDERGQPYRCLCNETYVAHACCGVRSGAM